MSDIKLQQVMEPAQAGFWGEDEKLDRSYIACRVVRNGDVAKNGYIPRRDLPVRYFPDYQLQKAEVKDVDVVLVSSGAYTGNAGIVCGEPDGLPVIASNFVRRLRAKPQHDAGWFFHLVRSDIVQRQVPAHTGGSAIPNLSSSLYAKCRIPFVPDKPWQSRIAEILTTVDEAIEGTERLIEKHQQIKAGLMHDLFTRGLTPDGHLRPPHTEAPELYKDSPLGPIPKEWEVVRLSALARNRDSERVPLKQEDRADMQGNYPYYGASGIIDWVDLFIFEGDFVLLGEDGENVMSRNLPLAFRVTGRFWANNHAHVFESLDDVDIRFLVELLEGTNYVPLVSGSAQPKITQSGLAKLWFVKPGMQEQARIADALEKADGRGSAEQSYLSKLNLLKSGLMHDLLTGRVGVTIPVEEPS